MSGDCYISKRQFSPLGKRSASNAFTITFQVVYISDMLECGTRRINASSVTRRKKEDCPDIQDNPHGSL